MKGYQYFILPSYDNNANGFQISLPKYKWYIKGKHQNHSIYRLSLLYSIKFATINGKLKNKTKAWVIYLNVIHNQVNLKKSSVGNTLK